MQPTTAIVFAFVSARAISEGSLTPAMTLPPSPSVRPALAGVFHVLRTQVVEERDGHALAVVAEVVRQRTERARARDGLEGRVVERRNAGAGEDPLSLHAAVLQDEEANREPALHAVARERGHVPIPLDLPDHLRRVGTPVVPDRVERERTRIDESPVPLEASALVPSAAGLCGLAGRVGRDGVEVRGRDAEKPPLGGELLGRRRIVKRAGARGEVRELLCLFARRAPLRRLGRGRRRAPLARLEIPDTRLRIDR